MCVCVCVITCLNVFSVWPKTTLLLPVQPRDAQRSDSPVRGSVTCLMVTQHKSSGGGICWTAPWTAKSTLVGYIDSAVVQAGAGSPPTPAYFQVLVDLSSFHKACCCKSWFWFYILSWQNNILWKAHVLISWNLGIGHFYLRGSSAWWRGPWAGEIILSYLSRPNLTKWSLKSKDLSCLGQKICEDWRTREITAWNGLYPPVLALELDEGGTSQKRWAASRSCKMQGNRLYPGASRRNTVLLILSFAQWVPC